MFKRSLVVAALSMLGPLANAAPISNSATGLASPALTITFDEHVLAMDAPVTNEYADLGVTLSPYLYYSPQTGFPNIIGNDVGNFGGGESGPDPAQFILNFLTNQTSVAFAMVSNSTSWTFEALLSNGVVETFNATVGTSANDFFGFTGLTFDQVRITGNDSMLIDNLQLGPANGVPEPATLGLLTLGLAGLGFVRRRKSKEAA